MAESLFPEDLEELTMDEDELEDEEELAGYAPGLLFDTDFVRDGRNMLRAASGIESWKRWCVNCLATERFASPLYSTDFGISTSEAFRAGTREEAETILASEITEALEADPYERVDYVSEIDFEWGVDYVAARVEIIGVDGATIDIEVPIAER